MPPTRHGLYPARRSFIVPALVALVALCLAAAGMAIAPTGMAAAAEPPTPTLTALSVTPSTAMRGDTVRLTATVTADGAPVAGGRITFDAAETEAQLFGADTYEEPYPDSSDVVLGSASVEEDGSATWELPLTAATLPFVDEPTPFFVAAQYQPFDGLETYDDRYTTSQSEATTVTAQKAPAVGTSIVVTGPDMATTSVASTLTAAVTPASAAGLVQFRVNGEPVGAPVPVFAGTASIGHTFEVDGTALVSASFVPTDPERFSASTAVERQVSVTSEALPDISVKVEAIPGVLVGGIALDLGSVPASGQMPFPSGMEAVRLTPALRVPDEAAKAGAFSVELDAPRFASGSFVVTGLAGEHRVTVTYTPADPAADPISREFVLRFVAPAHAMTTTITPTAIVAGGQRKIRFDVRVTGPAGVGRVQLFSLWVPKGPSVRLVKGVATMSFDASELIILGPIFGVTTAWAVFIPDHPLDQGLTTATADLAPLTWASAEQAARGAEVASVTATSAGANCRGGSTTTTVATGAAGVDEVQADVTTGVATCASGRQGGASARAGQRTSKVTCRPTATGYECPLGFLAAGTSFAVKGAFPLAASLAGRSVTVRTSTVSSDPVTGRPTTLASTSVRVAVPKRTVVAASMAPVRKGLSSVRRGKRATVALVLRNQGVITATKVRACVSLSAGAKVVSARGATVHGRRACWTLPKLRAGRSMTKKVTLRAPRRKGTVKIRVAVTPRASQAGAVRLAGVLPVK